LRRCTGIIPARRGRVWPGGGASTDAGRSSIAPIELTTILFEDAGQGEGWVDLDLPAGSYFMDIESDCAWTVMIGRA
jgi:hypothetical protein